MRAHLQRGARLRSRAGTLSCWLVVGLAACEPVASDTREPEHARQRALEARRGALAGGDPSALPAAPADTDEAPSGPLSRPERADVEQLGAVIGERFDPVEEALVAVDEAVERDLPVRAAQLIEASVLPASRALVARLEAIEPSSELGVSLRTAWLEACQARERALVAYADALGRGIVEDLTLADALRDQRRAGDRVASARAAHAAARRRIDASSEGE